MCVLNERQHRACPVRARLESPPRPGRLSAARHLRRTASISGILAGLLLLAARIQGQPLPLELHQNATLYNYLSQRGVPISSTVGNPPGSDGRAPNPGTGIVGTTNQFQALLSFGGGVSGPTPPQGGVSGGQVILVRARIGHPLVGRTVTFYFGEIIPPPDKDEYGVDLAVANNTVAPPRPPALPSDYWLAEPYSTTGHSDSAYYWSPHAERVYATEPGPATVVWRK
ncbi:MAG TPA: hypothetical protein VNM37_21650, partial [Candidatus Dormibacteraeota bacterium]|nr:hypothetical protein [Candidatus Dormibacteraeota bacterium]